MTKSGKKLGASPAPAADKRQRRRKFIMVDITRDTERILGKLDALCVAHGKRANAPVSRSAMVLMLIEKAKVAA